MSESGAEEGGRSLFVGAPGQQRSLDRSWGDLTSAGSSLRALGRMEGVSKTFSRGLSRVSTLAAQAVRPVQRLPKAMGHAYNVGFAAASDCHM